MAQFSLYLGHSATGVAFQCAHAAGSGEGGWGGYVGIDRIAAANINKGVKGNRCRISIFLSQFDVGSSVIAHIGKKSPTGDAYDFASTPTQIIWAGSGTLPGIGATQQEYVSDWFTLPENFDTTSDYLIAFGLTGTISTRNIAVAGNAAYYKGGAPDPAQVDKTGYAGQADITKFTSRIEISSAGSVVVLPNGVAASAQLGWASVPGLSPPELFTFYKALISIAVLSQTIPNSYPPDAGDILIAAVMWTSGDTTDAETWLVPPAGFVPIGEPSQATYSGAPYFFQCFWYRANGTETADWVFDHSGHSMYSEIGMYHYFNCIQTGDPIAAYSYDAGIGMTSAVPGLVMPVNNCALIIAGHNIASSTVGGIPGFSMLANEYVTAYYDGGLRNAAGSAPGKTLSPNGNNGASQVWQVWQVALLPTVYIPAVVGNPAGWDSSIDYDGYITFEDDDKTVVAAPDIGTADIFSVTGHASGKQYVEVTFEGGGVTGVGLVSPSPGSYGPYISKDGDIYIYTSGGNTTHLGVFPPLVEGDVVGMAIDVDAGKVWFRVNGGYWNNDPLQGPV